MRQRFLILALVPFLLNAQSIELQLEDLERSMDSKSKELETLEIQRDELRLDMMLRDLKATGLPSEQEDLIEHPGHILSWNEDHEQPNWVAHVVDTDIRRGNLARVDTFLPDPQVATGTSTTPDYWFSGFDRGHMVPSADMRWNKEAMVATYFYSNVAPQRPELNRGAWAEMEDWIRRYVNFSGNRVYVVTGPVLRADLPSMENEGRENEVSIPEHFFKVIADLDSDQPKGIAFLMPNGVCDKDLRHYSTSIDEIEQLTGLNFFPKLGEAQEAKIEADYATDSWVVEGDPLYGQAEPLRPPLPAGAFNTVQAKFHVGNEATVCGKVVSTRKSSKGTALYLNFDKLYPNQDFYATIWDYNGPNFSYDPQTYLKDKTVCVTGKVTLYQKVARISVNNENEVRLFDELKD